MCGGTYMRREQRRVVEVHVGDVQRQILSNRTEADLLWGNYSNNTTYRLIKTNSREMQCAF